MYRVDIESSPDGAFSVKAGSGSFVMDMKNKGVTPPDALLAALGSCIGVYIRKYTDGAGLALGKFSVSVESEFSAEPPLRFKTIKVVVDLKGLQLDERRQKALLEFTKNCPVHNTLKSNPLVETVLV
ncbi:MAG: OsmC family protein [Candidatus Omnitrophota bacterium]